MAKEQQPKRKWSPEEIKQIINDGGVFKGKELSSAELEEALNLSKVYEAEALAEAEEKFIEDTKENEQEENKAPKESKRQKKIRELEEKLANLTPELTALKLEQQADLEKIEELKRKIQEQKASGAPLTPATPEPNPVAKTGNKAEETYGYEDTRTPREIYLDQSSKRAEQSFGKNWEGIKQVDNHYEAFYYPEKELSGRSIEPILIHGSTTEEVYYKLKDRYDAEWRLLAGQGPKILEDLKKIGKERSEKIAKSNARVMPIRWILGQAKKAKEKTNQQINKEQDIKVNEAEYPFMYFAYDKINPKLQIYPRDFTNKNGEDPEYMSGMIFSTAYTDAPINKKVVEANDIVEFNPLGFFVVRDKRSKEGEQYGVVGPDGTLLTNKMDLESAKAFLKDEVLEYRNKLKEEFLQKQVD